MNETQIENALQAAAPVLPDALQTQILRQCRVSVAARERKYRRTQRTLWGAVFAVCALHWLIVGQLDAQNARWVNDGRAAGQTRVASQGNVESGELTAFNWRERKLAFSSLLLEANEVAR